MDDLRIVAVGRYHGNIEQYQLSDGRILGTMALIDLIKNNEITGYTWGQSVNGEYYVRTLPDRDSSNNLTNLPNINIRQK